MDDLISRRKAFEYFVTLWECIGTIMDRDEWEDVCITTANEIPAAQPEVVYCKKCKHWTRTCGDEQWGLGDCDVFDKHLVMCNGYCAWAERRTG